MAKGSILTCQLVLLVAWDEGAYSSSCRSEMLLIVGRVIRTSNSWSQPLQRHISHLYETGWCVTHVKFTRLLIDRAGVCALPQHHVCGGAIANAPKLIRTNLLRARWCVSGVLVLN